MIGRSQVELLCLGLSIAALVVAPSDSSGQQPIPPDGTVRQFVVPARTPDAPRAIESDGPVLPINLPTMLRLANANPLDIALATERLQAAMAQQDRARVLWLPTIAMGADYFRHDGQIQDIVGKVFTTSRSSFMIGAGPNAVFAVTDAIYAPLATRQLVAARNAEIQTAQNDSLLAVVEAYFSVQQARGDVGGAVESLRRAADLLKRTESLAPGLVPAVEVNRVRTELARRKQAVEAAYERWQLASANLTRLLRLAPSALVEPLEPPHTRVDLVNTDRPADELIPIALTYRPELASNQAIVQATLARLRQEKVRPFMPSVLLRGNATNPGGTLAGGYFGGGVNDNMSNFGARNSVDLQLVWELQNLGLGNRALVRERASENRQAVIELFRTQDRVASEVVQALAQVKRAVNRLSAAQEGLEDAVVTADRNLEGLGQTKRAGELVVLVFRPQEAVAAVTAMEQAYRDFYSAVADANRAQFRLYRALGQPAQCVLTESSLTPNGEQRTDQDAIRLLPTPAASPK